MHGTVYFSAGLALPAAAILAWRNDLPAREPTAPRRLPAPAKMAALCLVDTTNTKSGRRRQAHPNDVFLFTPFPFHRHAFSGPAGTRGLRGAFPSFFKNLNDQIHCRGKSGLFIFLPSTRRRREQR